MIISLKDTCRECLALHISKVSGPVCLWGYDIDKGQFKPLEACPKPMSDLEFSQSLKKQKKSPKEDDRIPVVVMQVNKKHWEKILAGRATIIPRNTFPRGIPLPFIVYVHVPGITGISGRFLCHGFETSHDGHFAGTTCMNMFEAKQMRANKVGTFLGWHVSAPCSLNRVLSYDLFGLHQAPTNWNLIPEHASPFT